MRACWLKWVGRDWSISADYIWLNYSGANIVELVQQPLVDVCVNGQLNTVQFYATTDSEAEVARCHFEAARAARKGGVDPESTACKLDKMIWLLCTGDFYREGGLKLFSTNALVESNLSAYSGDGI